MIRRISRARERAEAGFTLIELLVVIAILGILSGVVVFAVRGANDKGDAAASATDERIIRSAEEIHCAQEGTYASGDQLAASRYLSAPPELHTVTPGNTRSEFPEGNCPNTKGLPGDEHYKHYKIECLHPRCRLPLPKPPPAGVWSPRLNPAEPGTQPAAAAVTLPDGTVLKLAPSLDEIFDPVAALGNGLWRPTTSQKDISFRFYMSAAVLGGTPSAICPACGKALLYTPAWSTGYGSLQQWSIYDPQTGERSPTGATTWSRNYGAPIAVLAQSGPRCGPHCGKALTVGGGPGTGAASTSAELYDPKSNSWTPTGSFSGPTTGQSQRGLVALHDGTAMLVTTKVQIFEPTANDGVGAWRELPATSGFSGRNYNFSGLLVVLKEGRVLGVHNAPDPLAEVYDPRTETWTRTTSCECRGGTGLTLLGNGRVLLTGAREGTEPDGAAAYIYDPSTELWSRTGNLVSASYNGTPTLLQDGKVLLVGGGGETQAYTPG